MHAKTRDLLTLRWQSEANLSLFLLLLVVVGFVLPSRFILRVQIKRTWLSRVIDKQPQSNEQTCAYRQTAKAGRQNMGGFYHACAPCPQEGFSWQSHEEGKPAIAVRGSNWDRDRTRSLRLLSVL